MMWWREGTKRHRSTSGYRQTIGDSVVLDNALVAQFHLSLEEIHLNARLLLHSFS